MNKQLQSTLPDITPAKEWSQSTQDELFKHAATHSASTEPPPPSHAGGNLPEALVHEPEATPISPITIGAGQPGYGSVPMYDEKPTASPLVAGHVADAQAGVPEAGLVQAQTAPVLYKTVMVPVTGDVATPHQGYPTPPPLNRGESQASTALGIPGAWGRDEPTSEIQSAGPEGADTIITDAKAALSNAAAQAPGFFKNLQDSVGGMFSQQPSRDVEAGIPSNVAGLLPAPGPNDHASTTPLKSPEETMSPVLTKVPSQQELSSPALDGVPAGESRSNAGVTHVGNYALTTLPNSDEGNALNPNPGLVERATNVVGGAQAAVANAYNSETAGVVKDTGTRYLEMGMAAVGLGGAAAVAEKEEKEKAVDNELTVTPTTRHVPGVAYGENKYISPAERAARGMGSESTEKATEVPEGNKYAPDEKLDKSEHPIQTTSSCLPVTSAPPIPSESSGLTKPDDVKVPVAATSYPALEPYEGNTTSHGLEDREPIQAREERPLPVAPTSNAPPKVDSSTPSAPDAGGVHFDSAPPKVAAAHPLPATPLPSNAPPKLDTSAPAAGGGGSGWKSGVTGLNDSEVKEVTRGEHAKSAVDAHPNPSQMDTGSPMSAEGEHKRRSSLGTKIKGIFSRHKE